jgi:hypothetical protein
MEPTIHQLPKPHTKTDDNNDNADDNNDDNNDNADDTGN